MQNQELNSAPNFVVFWGEIIHISDRTTEILVTGQSKTQNLHIGGKIHTVNLAIFLAILKTLIWLFLANWRACIGDFDFLDLATLMSGSLVASL